MAGTKSNTALAASLIFAIALWGGNNAGTKFIVASWPPIWTGASRFLCAGAILLGVLRFTAWFGSATPVPSTLQTALWWRGGLSLAAYIVCFNWALEFTSASHVALYLGAAPVWALLWEGLPPKSWDTVKRYSAATLALIGVLVLFWPALKVPGSWLGEVLGLAASVLWTNYGRQCRVFGKALSGAQVSAHTMWRAGVLLVPMAVIELWRGGLMLRADVIGVQAYCILAGGVVAFAIWSNALRYWPASQVLLFNNLVPLSVMTWAHFWLGEPITPRFWVAMLLVFAGVTLAQVNWGKLAELRSATPE